MALSFAVNWLAVLVAFVVSAALAGAWFGAVIARPYLAALGLERMPKPVSPLLTNLGPIVCVLLTVLTSAVLLRSLGVTSVGDAVLFGLVVGIGYLTAMTFQIAINPRFPHPLRYGALNAPYFVISSVLSAVILTAIR